MNLALGQAFLDQARSDWACVSTLQYGDHPPSQWLHMLQMSLEKAGKAYLAAGGMTLAELRQSHVAFSKWLGVLSRSPEFARSLHMQSAQLATLIERVIPLCVSLERLAPAQAGSGPNVEYPWVETTGIECPSRYGFPQIAKLNSRQGRDLLKLLNFALHRFPSLSGLR